MLMCMRDAYAPPEEPLDIKRKALDRANSGQWASIDRNAVIKIFALSAQYLPKYLWRCWGLFLKARGVSWQLFLKAVSACDSDVIAWVEGKKPWVELVGVIAKVLEKARRGTYPLWPV